MQEESQDFITLFNERYTTNDVKVMKILHNGLPSDRQADFACLIRLIELQSIHNKPSLSACSSSEAADPIILLTACIPYLNEPTKTVLEQALDMLKTFRMVQDVMKTAELMKDFTSDSSDTDSISPDILMQLFGGNDVDISSIIQTMQEGETEKDEEQTRMDDG